MFVPTMALNTGIRIGTSGEVIPSEWNVDAECPRRYSKVFVYYNCVFTSTEKSNFVAVWNLVGGVTCITGKTVTILLITYFPISIH